MNCPQRKGLPGFNYYYDSAHYKLKGLILRDLGLAQDDDPRAIRRPRVSRDCRYFSQFAKTR